MSCHLIILYTKKKYVFYRTWYNCTNQIQQVLQLFFVILTLFRASLIQMKPVCNAFLDLFSNLISLVFFKNYGYLFFLTCKNNQKNYERAESEQKRKNKKKQYLIAKKNLKKSKFRTPPPSLFPFMHKHPILIEADPTLGRP